MISTLHIIVLYGSLSSKRTSYNDKEDFMDKGCVSKGIVEVGDNSSILYNFGKVIRKFYSQYALTPT